MVFNEKYVEMIVKLTLVASDELAPWFEERVREGCKRKRPMITPKEYYEKVLGRVKEKLEELEKAALETIKNVKKNEEGE